MEAFHKKHPGFRGGMQRMLWKGRRHPQHCSPHHSHQKFNPFCANKSWLTTMHSRKSWGSGGKPRAGGLTPREMKLIHLCQEFCALGYTRIICTPPPGNGSKTRFLKYRSISHMARRAMLPSYFILYQFEI